MYFGNAAIPANNIGIMVSAGSIAIIAPLKWSTSPCR